MISGLRARILVIVVLVSCLTAGTTGIAVTLVVRDWVYQDAQEEVLNTFQRDMARLEESFQISRLGEDYTVVSNGTVVRSGNARPEDVPARMRSELEKVPSLYRFQRLSDGRVLVAHSMNRNLEREGDSLIVYWVEPLDKVGQRLQRLTSMVVAAVVGSAVLGALVGLLIVRSVMRPLRRIQHVAGRVSGGDTHARLPATSVTELTDLTESFNAMLDRQNESIDVLRRQDERSRRFVGDVSHELRSPLAALVPSAEVLREEAAALPPDSDLRRASELLSAEVDNLASLVDDLLEMSRLDAGAAEVLREPFDLVATVRRALAARGWTTVTFDGEPALPMVGDPRRVVAVVTNLVGNAIRHGAPPVSVRILAAPRGPDGPGRAVVEVRDHGAGIPPGEENRVFGRFAKAQEARSREAGGGAGLGLAIARENAGLLGGDVDYRRDGDVTVFRARLAR